MAKRREVIYENGRYKGKYLDTSTCNRLEALLKLNKENGCVEDLKNVIYELTPSDIELIKETKSSEFVELKKGELSGLQTIGVAYMYFAKRLLLGDSVGMGKTVEVCGLCNLLEAEFAKQHFSFRFLFLTNKNSVSQIRDKMIKFTGNYVEEVYGEKDKVLRFARENETILNYSVVGSHSLITSVHFQNYLNCFMENNGYNPFDIIIIDESGDILKNSTTQTYKDTKQLVSNFNRVILLNATAFEKALGQFYNQLSLVDDSLLPTKTDFSDRYEVMEYGIKPYPVFNGKYKNEKEFRQLVGYRYLARTRKSSGAVMVDCTADVIVSDLSSVQKKLLPVVSMPNMVYDCPSYFKWGGDIETNEKTTPKIKSLLDLVKGKLKDEKSILIFARYKEAQDCIERILKEKGEISIAKMNGDTPQKEKNALINKFKLGDIRILITNVQKSLDFGDCNNCIFYDYDPNTNNMVQFEGRMTREFNIVGKHVYILISRGKELKTFKDALVDRAKASDMFAGSDFSCVLSLLLNNDKLKNIK